MKLASAVVAALAMLALVLAVVTPGAAAVQLQAQARQDANAALEQGEGQAGRAKLWRLKSGGGLRCGDRCPSQSSKCSCSCAHPSVPMCQGGGGWYYCACGY